MKKKVQNKILINTKFMIKVDPIKCKGCGVCEAMCPEVFKIDANGVSQVIGETCVCNLEDIIAACPENAISQE